MAAVHVRCTRRVPSSHRLRSNAPARAVSLTHGASTLCAIDVTTSLGRVTRVRLLCYAAGRATAPGNLRSACAASGCISRAKWWSTAWPCGGAWSSWAVADENCRLGPGCQHCAGGGQASASGRECSAAMTTYGTGLRRCGELLSRTDENACCSWARAVSSCDSMQECAGRQMQSARGQDAAQQALLPAKQGLSAGSVYHHTYMGTCVSAAGFQPAPCRPSS